MNKGSIIQGGSEIPFFDGHYINGSAIKLYDGYKIKDRQAVKIYQNGIEWTYSISGSGPSYGNSLQASATIVAAIDPAAGHIMFCTVTYTFQTPILMKSGQTLTISSSVFQMYSTNFAVAINGGANVFTSTFGNGTYTFPADTSVESISASVNGESGEILNNQFPKADLMVTVNSLDFGSFLLDNFGSSDQS